MADNTVKIRIATEEDLSGVESIENRLNRIKQEKIQLQLNAKVDQLEEANNRIDYLKKTIAGLEAVPAHLGIDIDEGEIQALKTELDDLEFKTSQLTLDVEKGELEAAKTEIEDLNGKTVEVNLAMNNIGDGVNQAKQGVSGLVSGLGEVQQAGLQSEQSFEFLKKNLGGDAAKANSELQKINNTVASMPGDDATMRQVLTTAVALGEDLDDSAMRAATGTMADYMQGAQMMGKNAREAQQDIMKYMLDGNTAELENNSIVSSKVDKLKEATTFQERQAAMQEVLNELGYGGVAGLDTTMNKQAEWEGMMFNAQDSLSRMWLGAEKGAMNYIIKLDEGTGGLLSMGLVAGQMAAGPVTDLMSGIGQIGLGLQTLKDAGDFLGISDKLGSLKDALMGVGSKAKEAALSMLDLGKKALISAGNALKAAGAWLVQKAQLIASTVATWAMAAAQAALNFIMSLNPIVLVVIALVALAAALIWAYQNVDWFRAMVDGAWQSIVQFAQGIWSYISPAIDWLSSLFTNFTSQLGLNTNDWIQALIGFLLFIPQLPLQLGIALVNAIARLFGFKGNFVQTMLSTGINAVSNFINQIAQLPGKLAGELQRMYSTVSEWAATLPQKFWDAGVNAVKNFLNALGIHSPGFMFYAMQGELNRIDKVTDEADFSDNITSMGQSMANSFNPNLDFYGNSSGSGAGMNLTINIESVDSEDRINQIVRAVEEALRFDNETAGRNV